jgi:phospholipid-transporting ATPase
MADDFTRLVSQANPAASQYRPTYPPTTANTPTTGLDPFFDDDDDLELGTPTPQHINTTVHARGGGNLLSPDAPPDSAFGSAQAMQSTDSELPLSKHAAPPAGSSHVWGFDDEDVQLPSTFSGSAAFPGTNSQPPPKLPRKSTKSRRWRWPWQEDQGRDGDRVVALNDEHANLAEAYCSNYVSTSKYSLATFLPKFLTGMHSSSHP